MSKHRIAVLPGDGIGPEVMKEALRVLESVAGKQGFEVVTDDGYTFEMRRAGDNNKNLESVGNLRVLGRWFKGRLEDADVLKLTEKITEETLALYGKRTIELTPIQDGSDRWYMNFAPDSEQ